MSSELESHEFPESFLICRIVNAAAACFLGVVLNLIVFIGVVRVPAHQLNSYRYIVGVLTFVDLLFAFTAGVTVPGFDFHNGFIAIITGPVAWLGVPELSHYVFVFYNLTYYTYFLLQPVTFVCRYFAICQPKIASYLNTKPALWGGVVLTTGYGLIQGYLLAISHVVTNENPRFESAETHEKLFVSAHVLAQSGSATLMTVHVVMYASLIVVVLFLMFFCSLKIFLHLRRNSNHFTLRTIEAHRRLTVALVLQALFPILTGVIPSIICMYLFFTEKADSKILWYTLMFHIWQPVISPIITLCFVAPVRNALARLVHAVKSPNTVFQMTKSSFQQRDSSVVRT